MQQFAVSFPSSSFTQLVDSFRYLHPSQEKAYTCWSTVLDCRKINYGTRIDYILVSSSLASRLKQAAVWAHVEGSDHCPVYAEIELTVLPASRPPPLCSGYFTGLKQKKLSMFLSARPKPALSAALSCGEERDSTKAVKVSRKRSLPSTASSSVKAKRSSQSVGKGQTLLLSMFQRAGSKPDESGRDSMVDGLGEAGGSGDVSSSQSVPDQVTEVLADTLPPSTTSQLSEEWRGVFTGPPKPPVCQGHNEPCVLRTVKKAGPNRNRQFWSCVRPGGSKGDPAAKCNYFKWATVVRTGRVKVASNNKSSHKPVV